MKKINSTSTFDLLVSDLCWQIDSLKSKVEYYKGLYEKEVMENSKRVEENLQSAKKGVANALLFALSVKDDENGNLVISSEDRKHLAESINRD